MAALGSPGAASEAPRCADLRFGRSEVLKVRFAPGADSDYIQCAAALFRHRAISQEAGATERAPEADGTGRIALTPELQKGSLHNVFGSRPVTAVSEAF